ncbi:MAG: hypothetical protein MUD05_12380, partial [Candidatus Nanopelagicales bacterium]|nr:hypothetical protein [Candidatus Nanopelagicales bacterium]
SATCSVGNSAASSIRRRTCRDTSNTAMDHPDFTTFIIAHMYDEHQYQNDVWMRGHGHIRGTP